VHKDKQKAGLHKKGVHSGMNKVGVDNAGEPASAKLRKNANTHG
jgi:hypothetical protein